MGNTFLPLVFCSLFLLVFQRIKTAMQPHTPSGTPMNNQTRIASQLRAPQPCWREYLGSLHVVQFECGLRSLSRHARQSWSGSRAELMHVVQLEAGSRRSLSRHSRQSRSGSRVTLVHVVQLDSNTRSPRQSRQSSDGSRNGEEQFRQSESTVRSPIHSLHTCMSSGSVMKKNNNNNILQWH